MASAVELYLPGSGGRPAPLQPGFVREVERHAGRLVSRCYQCKKCTSGCPVGPRLDYQCHEVIRLVQLGAKEAVLGSRAIWLCASCKTCRERCPNDVDPAQVMDTLKILAVAAGAPLGRKRVKAFQKAFLSTVAAMGRSHEFGSIALYLAANPSAGIENLGLGLKMLARGKLKLLPDGIRGKRDVKAIFRRAAQRAARLAAEVKAGSGADAKAAPKMDLRTGDGTRAEGKGESGR